MEHSVDRGSSTMEVPAKPDEDVCRHVQQVAHMTEAAVATVQSICRLLCTACLQVALTPAVMP